MDTQASMSLSIGLVNSLFSILSLISLTCLVRFEKVIFSHPKAFRSEIFDINSCLINFTTEEIFKKEHPFFIYVTSLLALWIISIGAIVLLHKYLDPIKRFRISKLLFKCLTYVILFVMFIFAPSIILLVSVIMETTILLSWLLDLGLVFWLSCCFGWCCLDLDSLNFGFFTRNALKFFNTQKR